MAETFYSVLGVDTDADAEAIRRAYREQVKEHHPDVSDDPAAPDEFRRLTTAKEVLVDETERRRYDRLGHSEYVGDYVDASVWSRQSATNTRTTSRTASATTPSSSREGQSRTRTTDGRTTTTQATSTGGGARQQARRSTTGAGDGRRRGATATAAAEDWQHASEAYRRGETSVPTGRQSTLRSIISGLLSVGPWLLVHLIFIASAVATAYLAVTTADAHLAVSWPTLLGVVLLLGAVVFVSVLHVVSQLYS